MLSVRWHATRWIAWVYPLVSTRWCCDAFRFHCWCWSSPLESTASSRWTWCFALQWQSDKRSASWFDGLVLVLLLDQLSCFLFSIPSWASEAKQRAMDLIWQHKMPDYSKWKGNEISLKHGYVNPDWVLLVFSLDATQRFIELALCVCCLTETASTSTGWMSWTRSQTWEHHRKSLILKRKYPMWTLVSTLLEEQAQKPTSQRNSPISTVMLSNRETHGVTWHPRHS